MNLKVCGVRTMTMAQACQDLSVPYVGFNFVESSKRYINPVQAQKLSHAYTGRKVGVFQNAPLETILETAQLVDLDIIQLHGEEDLKYIEDLKTALLEVKPLGVWKAFGIDENFKTNEMQLLCKNCDLFLLDGKNAGSGTQIVNKQLLADAILETQNLGLPYALAGGINPDSASLLLPEFHTAALFDTASGVETNDEFDRNQLERLLKALEDV